MKSTIEKALLKQQQAKQIDGVKTADNSEVGSNDSSSQQISAESTPKGEDTKATKESIPTPSETLSTADSSFTPEQNFLSIDLERLESLGFVTTSDPRRRINEEYREIKRKLIQNAFGPLSKTLPNSNIIMVTSARPSEGKTFTAVNLALSIAAEQDKTVLLVDADVLKPNVLKTLDLRAKNGLMDYLLSDSEPLSQYIYRTNVDKLRIIPAGSSHHLSTELLASTIMHETVNEFSTRYPDRIVIIDTPPIIGINESAILASFAGQAVVVVEEGKSKLSDIETSVERLNQDMAVGFVVNKSINTTEAGGYYGYYYGHEPKPEKE